MDTPLAVRRPATDPKGPTGRVAHWLATLSLDAIPATVRERARHVILDGVGCALVGAQLPWSRKAVAAVAGLEAAGQGTVIGHGLALSPPAAALLNGTFIQGFELDDFHVRAPLHSASLVLPALFGAAESLGRASGADLLLGAIAGFEVGPRVGLALHGVEMLTRGWHSGSVFGGPAAAAAAGVLYRLDAAGFEDALGLGATQAAGLMAAQFEAMSKRMHHGFAARNGLYAAALAAGGYTGIKRVFEREYGGYLSTFGEGHNPDPAQIADGLGERWETLGIAIKPHAAMAGLHGAIDLALALKARHPFAAGDVTAIEVRVGEAVFHHGGWVPSRPLTEIGAQMNLAYAVAVAVIDGAALVAQFAPSRIDRDDVWDLIPRIGVVYDAGFDAGGPEEHRRTRLAVTLRDGGRLEADTKTDGRSRALSNLEIVEKFRRLTAGIVSDDRRGAIAAAVLGIDGLPDARALIGLLAAPVGAALG